MPSSPSSCSSNFRFPPLPNIYSSDADQHRNDGHKTHDPSVVRQTCRPKATALCKLNQESRLSQPGLCGKTLPRRSGRLVQPPGGSYGRGERTSVGASLGAGPGSRRVGARRSGRRSGVGAPAPAEPAGPPPLPRGGKPTE